MYCLMTCRKAGSEMLNTKEQGNLCFVFFQLIWKKQSSFSATTYGYYCHCKQHIQAHLHRPSACCRDRQSVQLVKSPQTLFIALTSPCLHRQTSWQTWRCCCFINSNGSQEPNFSFLASLTLNKMNIKESLLFETDLLSTSQKKTNLFLEKFDFFFKKQYLAPSKLQLTGSQQVEYQFRVGCLCKYENLELCHF